MGKNNEEFFIASDASPFIEYTKNVVYLEDEEMAIIKLGRDIRVRRILDDLFVDPYYSKTQIKPRPNRKRGLRSFYDQGNPRTT